MKINQEFKFKFKKYCDYCPFFGCDQMIPGRGHADFQWCNLNEKYKPIDVYHDHKYKGPRTAKRPKNCIEDNGL